MPVLKVDKKLLELIRDMDETLDVQKDPEGLGLAAPQVGVFQRMFILKPLKQKLQVFIANREARSDKKLEDPLIFINPEIVKLSKKTNDVVKIVDDKKVVEPTGLMEGCLSLPHYYGPVQRAQSVTLKYAVPELKIDHWELKIKQKTFTGFLAHIIQHEIDHLNGVFFIDHLLKSGRKLYQMKGKEWYEVKLV